MARRAEVILDVQPKMSGLHAFEREAMASAQRIREAMNEATGAVTGGADGDRSAARKGFWAQFMIGWGRAGGFGSAVATVTKYAAAYKMLELGSRAAWAPIVATSAALKSATRSWIDYEQAVADAARTFRQAGFSDSQLIDVLGSDALKFMTKYRATLAEVALAQYELGSANFDAIVALEAYQTPVKVNIALMGDMTQTTQFMTQLLKIHGDQMGQNLSTQEKMSRIGGILARTWEIEQVELSELAAAYKYVAGNAKLLALPLEELVPLLGLLSTYGLRGSIGGTGTNQFLTQLSRTITLTEEGLLKIKKLTRGTSHEIDLGLKPGDVKSPIQILTAIGKAIAPMGKDFVGKLVASGALNDIFNIRGGRPAALLSDLNVLRQYLEAVSESYRMTANDADAYIETLVKLRQETVSGQWDLLKNNIYATGVEFVKAAAGGETLVEAIKNIIDTLNNLKPVIIKIGYQVHGRLDAAAAFLESWSAGEGIITANRRGNAARVNAEFENVQKRILSAATKKALTAKDETEFEQWRRNQVYKAAGAFERMLRTQRDPLKDHLGVSRERANELTDLWLRRVQDRSVGTFNIDAWTGKSALLPGMIQAEREIALPTYSLRLWENLRFGDVKKSALQQRIEDTMLNPNKRFEQMMQGMDSSYSQGGARGGAGGGADAASLFRKEMDQITAGILLYKEATQQTSTSLDLVEIQEQRLNRLMSDRLITTELLAQSEAKVAEKTAVQHAYIAALTAEKEELARQEAQLIALAQRAPDADSAQDAREKAFAVRTEMMQKQVEIARTAENINVAMEKPLANRFLKFQQNFKFEAEQFERSMRTYREALEGPADALGALEIEERLFGQTTQTAASKVDVLTDSIMRLSSAREKSEAEAVNMRYTYESLATIRDALGRGEGLTEAQLAHLQKVWSPEQIAAAQQSGQLYSWVGEALSGYASRADEARRATKYFSDQIADQNAQLIEAQRVILTLGTDRAFEDFESRLETAQAVLGARGIDWETSTENVAFLTEQIELLFDKLVGLDLQFSKGVISYEEYVRQIQRLEREIGVTRARREQAGDARKAMETDLRKRMLETRASWIQGGGAEAVQRQIAVNRKMLQYEMEALRKQYPDPWAEGILKEYEQVMEKNIIVQPWLEARDQIQQEWTQMFSDLYTGLVSGGTNPWKAFVESIIGSVQGRIMQMLVQKYLAPLFDFMASAQTGISIAEAKAIEADASAQVSVALTELTVAAQAATAALTEATTAMSGGGTGGGISRTQMILGAMAAAGGSAGGGGSMPMSIMGMPGGGWGQGVGGFLGTAFQVYGAGSLYGGLLGSILGKDPADSSKKAGIGGLIGYAITGTGVGGLIGGLLGGLFGKKKEAPKQEDSIDRMLYGMPAFEYESYLYNLTKKSPSKSTAYGSIYSKIVRDHASGYRPAGAGASGETFIQININGGDIGQVKKVVDDALARNFGPVASIKVVTSV